MERKVQTVIPPIPELLYAADADLFFYADTILLSWYLKGKGETLRYAGIIFGITLALGAARVIQGLYHSKPVGHLELLLLLHLAVSGVMRRRGIA